MYTKLSRERLTIFFYNGLGDAFLALPTLNALSSIFKGHIDIITAKSENFISILNTVERNHLYTINIEEDEDTKTFDFNEFENSLVECSCFLSLNQWYPRDINSFKRIINSFDSSIGFYSFFKNFLLRTKTQHAFDQYFMFAHFFDEKLNFKDFLDPPEIDELSEMKIKTLRDSLPESSKILVVHTDTEQHKMWQKEDFDELIDYIIESYSTTIVIIIGTNLPHLKKSNNHSRVLKLKTTFKFAWSLVARSDIFVGVDSVFLHIADLYRRPSIGLFGPTSPNNWGLKISPLRFNILSKSLTMDGISFNDVAKKIDILIKRSA